MNKVKLFILLLLSSLSLLLPACSKQPAAQTDPDPHLPFALSKLQGEWRTDNSNEFCSATFQGYTIRLRYKDQAHETQHKQNVLIDRVDTDRHCLIINSGSRAWPYQLSTENGQQQLSLEFNTSDGWKKMQLTKTDAASPEPRYESGTDHRVTQSPLFQ